MEVGPCSVVEAAESLVGATHVALSVDGHLGQHALLKVIVAGRARDTPVPMCSLQAVRCVRLLRSGATGRLGLPGVAHLLTSTHCVALHAGNTHLIVLSGRYSARLRTGEIGVAPLRTCRRGLVHGERALRVSHQQLVVGRTCTLAVHNVALLHIS